MRRLFGRLKALMRRALPLMVAVLLVAFPAVGVSSSPQDGVGVEEGCDCCPDRTPGDGEDCCETDGGLCCVTGSAAVLLPATSQPEQPLLADTEHHSPLPPDLLLPRANSPPPTPPPIA